MLFWMDSDENMKESFKYTGLPGALPKDESFSKILIISRQAFLRKQQRKNGICDKN